LRRGNLEAGQLFGEMALIGDKPRTATAKAASDCLCFELPHKVFESELTDSSAPMRSLVHNLIGHIRSLMDKLD
jgi:CRP-like cAMP-binding protein